MTTSTPEWENCHRISTVSLSPRHISIASFVRVSTLRCIQMEILSFIWTSVLGARSSQRTCSCCRTGLRRQREWTVDMSTSSIHTDDVFRIAHTERFTAWYDGCTARRLPSAHPSRPTTPMRTRTCRTFACQYLMSMDSLSILAGMGLLLSNLKARTRVWRISRIGVDLVRSLLVRTISLRR